MERHTSFEKLKGRTNSSSTNNFISTTTENNIISFIDLLKASVIPAPKTIDMPTIANSQTNPTIHGR